MQLPRRICSTKTSIRSAKLKRYVIREHPYYGVYPGKLADGTPVIAFSGYPAVTLVYFDAEGEMTDTQQYPPFKTKSVDRSEDGMIERERDYLKTLGIATFEPVTVQKFWVGDMIGIEQYPSSFAPVLPDHEVDYLKERDIFKDFYGDNWKKAFDDEIRDLKQQLKEWDENGAWVLWHGNDYWVDVDGHITDS